MSIDLGTLTVLQCQLYSGVVAVGATLSVDPNGACHWHLHDGELLVTVEADGNMRWYNGGKIHRDGDQPAYIGADGNRAWWKDGKRHRDGDQPAMIWADGSIGWFKDGKHQPRRGSTGRNLG